MADGYGGAIDGRASESSQPRSADVESTKFGDCANLHQGDQHIGQSSVNILNYNYGAWPPQTTGNNAVIDFHGDQPHEYYWTVPFGLNKDFIGREVVLDRLLEMIPPQFDKDDCQRTAIEGLGGVGKTQVAPEAAFRVCDKYRDCHVFWVPAIDATTFENAYRDIGRKLKIPGIDDGDTDVKLLVKTALSRSVDKWLLIIDNADDADLFYNTDKASPWSDSLPFNLNGSILFTTRNDDVRQKLDIRREDVVSLTELSRPEAVHMLQKGLSAHQISNAASAMSLLDFLSDLPLGIKQASAYMAKTGMGITQYVEHCRSSDGGLIELLSKDFEDRGRYKSAQNPVTMTWLISFTTISRDNPLAAKYLQYMSLLAEKDIPKHLLPLYGNELETYEAIGMLKSYAFISERTETDTYDMHRLVRLVMQNWLAKQGQLKLYITAVMERLIAVYPSALRKRGFWARYLPHALAALKFKDQLVDETPKWVLENTIAESLYRLGKYKEVERLSGQMLEWQRRVNGPEHPRSLMSMNIICLAHFGQGKYKEAEQLLQELLELRSKVLGSEHPDTLVTKIQIAKVLHQQGKCKEAIILLTQTFELRTQVLGANHLSTISSMVLLADMLNRHGKYNEAERSFQGVLELQIKVLGAGHPDRLLPMDVFSRALYKRGKYNEAEQVLQETLKLRLKALGPEHPDTLVNMRNLDFAKTRAPLPANDERQARD